MSSISYATSAEAVDDSLEREREGSASIKHVALNCPLTISSLEQGWTWFCSSEQVDGYELQPRSDETLNPYPATRVT